MERLMVVMAGGSGERFWPLSRKHRPKQLLALTGTQTMLEETVERAEAVVGRDRVFIVAGPHLVQSILDSLPGFPKANCIVEPEARNTAPCLALAAGILWRRFGTNIAMGVLSADHSIRDRKTFETNMNLAFEYAESNRVLMTFGARPSEPHTGYGYLEVGDPVVSGEAGTIRPVKAFHEKPERETAERYMHSGRFLWNSGMFVWSLDALHDAFDRHAPEYAEAMLIFKEHEDADSWGPTFRALPKISIDYAIMEKADNVFCTTADFDWDDVGTWTALTKSQPLDPQGNLVRGKCIPVETSNTILFNATTGNNDTAKPNPVIVALGVENLVVVSTDDALFVCPKDRVQDIKKAVQALRDNGFVSHT
jgi:mannose-1-phosphate guanylyltransferase